MKQAFQFSKDKFCNLSMKLIGVRQPSFLREEHIGDTLRNCLIALEGEELVSVEDIFFAEHGKAVPNGNTVTDVHFTLVKNEKTKNAEFLEIISKFNS